MKLGIRYSDNDGEIQRFMIYNSDTKKRIGEIQVERDGTIIAMDNLPEHNDTYSNEGSDEGLKEALEWIINQQDYEENHKHTKELKEEW